MVQVCSFRAGEPLGILSSMQGQATMLAYIEEGEVELRWEADLPVPLSDVVTATMQQLPGRVLRPASPARDDRYLDHVDSVALTSTQVANLATMISPSFNDRVRAGVAARAAAAEPSSSSTASGSRQPADAGAPGGSDSASASASDPLSATLQQAAQRAQALMSNAAGGSLDNLLIAGRGPMQYVGALSLLDPDYIANRWRATAVTRTDVEAVMMNREGLDLFLGQNPLAQVHLRASMALARAEITKLEVLERIAEAHRRAPLEARPARGVLGRRRASWRVPWVPLGGVVEAATGVVTGAASTAAGAASTAAGTVAGGVQQAGAAAQTATHDIFALVHRMRDGLHASLKEAFVPLPG